MHKTKHLFIVIIFLFYAKITRAQKIEILQQGNRTSIRGLSVVNDKTAWISGSGGYVSITKDGGKTWNWQQVKGYEKADFRDIEAFSDKEAIIMSSGTPAYILKTVDGGVTWNLKYSNNDKAYFLDAMDFADKKHGFILGDPINSKFLLLETNDAGNSWHSFNDPPDAQPGEAAFAASGTCLRVDVKTINIVTGGTIARVLTHYDQNPNWVGIKLDIKHGQQSQGAFSASGDLKEIVGGDYSNDKNRDSVETNLNQTKAIGQGPAGYQSCVELINKRTYLSTGTSGSNITTDSGLTWQQIDTVSFNVCRKAKKGKLVLLAGDKGKIAILHL